MTTGRFIPDSMVPAVEEVDLGDGIKQLVIRYKNEGKSERKATLEVFQFLPREEKIIDMVPMIKKKKFPWHDFLIYVMTSVPILITIFFAKELMSIEAFLPFGIASFAWFWFVFLVNTKAKEV